MTVYCGIDFGTSNSAVAFAREGDVALVELENSQPTIPTAVFFNTEEGRVVFGRTAVSEYLEGYTGRLMRSLKSILGSDLISETTQIGSKRVDFKNIIGLFIHHIKAVSEIKAGHVIEDAVLGRPVHFVDQDDIADQRAEDELRAIAMAQGFKNISFEYEPLAAARDYESTLNREELVLVIDIGGGTSDFSLIRLSPERRHQDDRSRDILGHGGVHIGGTDFDKRFNLMQFMPHMGYQTKLRSGLDMPMKPYQLLATWHLINMVYTPQNKAMVKDVYGQSVEKKLTKRLWDVVEHRRGHELASVVEAIKIELSQQQNVSVDLGFIENDWILNLHQSDLIASAENDMLRIMDVAQSTIRAAGVHSSDIQTIFMTGGSTGLPGFMQVVENMFPMSHINRGDVFASVAKGLGYAALRRYA